MKLRIRSEEGLMVLRPSKVHLKLARGENGLEWQEAQSALGLTPSGHAIDVLFLCLLLAGIAALAASSCSLPMPPAASRDNHDTRGRMASMTSGIAATASPNTTIANNIFYNLPNHIYVIYDSTSKQGLSISHNLAFRSEPQAGAVSLLASKFGGNAPPCSRNAGSVAVLLAGS